MKFPTMEEWAKDVAEKALDECEYKGKTLRQWVEIILATDNNVGTKLGTNLASLGTDAISRQQAIDAVMECYDNDELFEVYEWKLNELPPIQPDIVRCKDCKHWIPYDWMFSEMWQSKNIADYPEDEIDCEWSEMSMKANDFCSRAERREVTT